MKNRPILIAGIAIAILVGGFFYNKYRIAPKLQFESLQLKTLTGLKVSPVAFKGEKVFLNFFATWCGPCIRELPSLEAAQEALRNEPVHFFLISDEPVSVLKRFEQTYGTRLTILHSEKKLPDLKIVTVPTSYLLNGKGETVFKKTGEENWASDAMIEKLRNSE